MGIPSLIEERVSIIVTRAFDKYGTFNTEEERRTLFEVSVRMILLVNNRVKTNDLVSIYPLKSDVLKSLFLLEFNREVVVRVFELVVESVKEEIILENLLNDPWVKKYEKYVDLIREAISDREVFIKTDILDHLLKIKGYEKIDSPLSSLGSTSSRLLRKNRVRDGGEITGSRRLKSNFFDLFNERVKYHYDTIVKSAVDINSITSDSYIYPIDLANVDINLLSATFAGGGKGVYDGIVKLYNLYVEFGGFQGSLSSSAEYLSVFSEYMLAMSYGKKVELGILSDEFGKFDGELGIKFLLPLHLTRSGDQGMEELYRTGAVKDRHNISTGSINFQSLILEAIYVECLKIGDCIKSLIDRPLPGIGDTTYLLTLLQSIFPPSENGLERGKGLTGSVYKLLAADRRLFFLNGNVPDFPQIPDKLSELSSALSDFSQIMKELGFREGNQAIPHLDLNPHTPDKERIKSNLLKVGFTDQEVQTILSVKTFNELVTTFAPLTDSQDVISFFRAYELTKLIYSFGGQEAINLYIDFLYGSDSTVLRLLRLLDKNRSLSSKVVASDYSKLVGYLITLTYAINPTKLTELDILIKRNNLDLFESISILYKEGSQFNVLKGKNEIDMLSAVAAQMVTVDTKDYSSQKPLWNRLIEQSAGNAKREELEGVYDKIDGILPEELNSILRLPPATSPLGKLMDGVRGGSFTSLLRYCNIFGLLYSISPYRNSEQLVNNHIKDYGKMVNLVSSLDKLSERLKYSSLLLEGDRDNTPISSDIVNVQNKGFYSFINLISKGDRNVEPAIVESPGIGNSRIPNGVKINDSLSPEEALLLQKSGSSLGVFSQTHNPAEGKGFIRFAQTNILGLVKMSERELGLLSRAEDDLKEELKVDPPVTAPEYVDTYSPTTINNQPPLLAPSYFDPVTSCKRFGGTNCEQGVDEKMCKTPYNKALAAEGGYGQTPRISPNPAVLIDRPLGQTMSVSRNYTSKLSPSPFSLSGLSLAPLSLRKGSEMVCGSIDDPLEYSMCLSLLKCKKFRPDSENKYLSFCPKIYRGGRLS